MALNEVDRNLLFGFLALQNSFLTKEELIAAVSVWLEDKSRDFAAILCERKALNQNERQLLTALMKLHLERHGNDIGRSLATLKSVRDIHGDLQKLNDPEVEATISHVRKQPTAIEQGLIVTELVGGRGSREPTRFQILRPHAAGGLGQVYVAKDEELNREVALKEIKAAYADSPTSRSRFVLEAEVTGGLEHPGIVPVYGLGQYSDGRPYYAMRFIRGDSLRDEVARFFASARGRKRNAADHEAESHDRNPTAHLSKSAFASVEFRNLLGRFIDVCQAIEYAHSRGVLHRDLKPGNIMLGKYGETLVVDWGLAKAQGRDELYQQSDERTLHPRSGSGSAATEMGSIIGTPGYMSPEQAAGRLDELGPVSDVYSLGATLYAVLTGRGPLGKGTVDDLLRQISLGKFPRPREIQPNLPKPLEAICLKAMALNPEERYASAARLAKDLECWLADEPVVAQRESWFERMQRWARRHKAFVQAGVAALVLVATMSTVAFLVVNRARQNEARAKDEAQQLYLAARGYLDRWLPAINEVLRYSPKGVTLRENMLAAAAQDYERLATFQSNDPERELDRGRTQLRLGETQLELGQVNEALATFQAAGQHFAVLAKKFPQRADAARVEQAWASNREGTVHEVLDDPAALGAWRKTTSLLATVAKPPEIDADRRLVLASAELSMAHWLGREKQYAAARKSLDAVWDAIASLSQPSLNQRSPAKADQLQRIQLTAIRLTARLATAEGNWDEARQLLTNAARRSSEQLEDSLADPQQLATAADIQIELASLLRQLGLCDQELAAYATALAVYRRLNKAMPDNPDHQESIALTLLDQAQLLVELNHVSATRAALGEAQTIVRRLNELSPQNVPYQQELAVLLEMQGRLAHLTGDDQAAATHFKNAISLLTALAHAQPDVHEYVERAAVARVQLGRCVAALGEQQDANESFEKALAELNDVRSRTADQPQIASEIAWLHFYRGGMLWDGEQPEQAAAEFASAIRDWREVVGRWPSAASYRAFAELLANCPVTSLRDSEQAQVLSRQALRSAPNDAISQATLAWALLRAGKAVEAQGAAQQALAQSEPGASAWFALSVVAEDQAVAREAFDKGTALWRHAPGDESLRRLAKEAASKLGLQWPP